MAWHKDEDGLAAKEKLQRQLEQRKAKGEEIRLFVPPKGKKLATEFWGQAWQRHLEGLADYESRLPRGRSYLRQGNIYNLEIARGLVTAEVAGEYMYEVSIRFTTLSGEKWDSIKQACAGQITSMLDLLSGKVADGVTRVILDEDYTLFPRQKDISISCNCPDWAGLCKHSAAVLYAVGLEFDRAPELFFTLRGVDHRQLISAAEKSISESSVGDLTIIPDDQIAGLFDIDI
ncbi:MAG: SWIM zinc finger family protein [Verrucomicrobiaceae bacterium]|nr:SWIM zinc finger family protein [Verrucomicrobiaceae bacterium]